MIPQFPLSSSARFLHTHHIIRTETIRKEYVIWTMVENIDFLGVFCIIINFESCCAAGSPQVQRHRTRENIYVVTMDQQSANTQEILRVFQDYDGNATQVGRI